MQRSQPPTEVTTLLDRYLLGLDDDKLDDAWARSLFTDDAAVEFPMSRHRGMAGLAEYHRSALAAFDRTQHLGSPAVVDLLDADRATLRANVISTHVKPDAQLFTAGTLVRGEARRTPDGWRLAALSFALVWTTGDPPRPGAPR